MIALTNKENQSYHEQNTCYTCKKQFSTDDSNEITFKKYYKVRDHCHFTGKYRGAAHNACNLRYKTPKEIPAVFHNCSKQEYHFIIEEVAEEFEGQFKCLGENTEKYITFQYQLKMIRQLHTN